MNETQYQAILMRKIENLIPGSLVLKNDPRYTQGIPDILILYKNKWAMLEVKMSELSHVMPNQQYYVDALSVMSFASFINPDNEEEVLNDLQCAFGLVREARISES